jgi:hypothetical protein
MDIPSGVVSIGTSAFYDCDALRSVSIPATVTEIGSSIFRYCDVLESVTIAEGITSIGEYMFAECKIIPSVTLPESIVSIGANSFYQSGIVSVTIPAGVESIGSYAFQNCYGLESITIYGVPECGNGIFANCSAVKSLTAGSDMLKYIPKENLVHVEILSGDVANGTFSGCKKLTSVILPSDTDGVIIGQKAFYNCISLMSITIPKNIEGIGTEAFAGCRKLVEVINLSSKNIVIDDENGNGGVAANALIVHSGESLLDTVDDYVFITVEGVHYLVGYVGADTELVLPESYNGESYRTLEETFRGNGEITSITIRGAVNIADYFFYDSTSLKTVVIGDDVETIGAFAFDSCEAIQSVTIGNGVTYVGEAAFRNCMALKSLTIGSSVEEIGNEAFYNCASLAKIALPASVTRIGRQAIYTCDELIGVSFADSSYMWNVFNSEPFEVPYNTLAVDDASMNVSNLEGYGSYYWIRADVDTTPEVETEEPTEGETEAEMDLGNIPLN